MRENPMATNNPTDALLTFCKQVADECDTEYVDDRDVIVVSCYCEG